MLLFMYYVLLFRSISATTISTASTVDTIYSASATIDQISANSTVDTISAVYTYTVPIGVSAVAVSSTMSP